MQRTSIPVLLIALCSACGSGRHHGGDDDDIFPDADIDTDADSDGDTDADADTDSDGDTDGDAECGDETFDGDGSFVSDCWSITNVGPGTEVGNSTGAALGVDGDGAAHIVYTQFLWDFADGCMQLRYVTNAGGEWIRENILYEEAPGGHTGASLAVDRVGVAHVAFVGYTDGRHYYGTRAGGDWTIEEMGFPGGRDHQIAIAEDGVVHVAYGILDGDEESVGYGTLTGGAWNGEVVDGPGKTGRYLQLALDGADAAHLAYWDVCPGWDEHPCLRDEDYPHEKDLRYATNSGGGFGPETIEYGHHVALAIAADGNGAAHVAYFSDSGLRYGTNAGGDWQFELITEGFSRGREGPSIAADADGHAHVVFGDSNYYVSGALRYATNRGGGWTIEEIADLDAISIVDSAIVVDADGIPHIAYDLEDGRGSRIRYAVRDCPGGG